MVHNFFFLQKISRNCPTGLETSINYPAGLARRIKGYRFCFEKPYVKKTTKFFLILYNFFFFCSKSSETSKNFVFRACTKIEEGGGPVRRTGHRTQNIFRSLSSSLFLLLFHWLEISMHTSSHKKISSDQEEFRRGFATHYKISHKQTNKKKSQMSFQLYFDPISTRRHV